MKSINQIQKFYGYIGKKEVMKIIDKKKKNFYFAQKQIKMLILSSVSISVLSQRKSKLENVNLIKCSQQNPWHIILKLRFSDIRILQILIKSWQIQSQFLQDQNQQLQIIIEMGLLSDMGPLLSFQEGDKLQPILKTIAIRQFLKVLQKYRKWKKPSGIQEIKWGEQIQGNFLQKDQQGKLQLSKTNVTEDYSDLEFPLMFEYGSFMFEMTPTKPYNTRYNLDEIIRQIRYKYNVLQSKKRMALTIPCIPFMGVRERQNQKQFVNQITKSEYISDDHIAPHPRFPTLTKNIRLRRKQKVDIRVPLLIDQNTNFQEIRATNEPFDGDIYLDAMCFGMGLSCLQCTFSTKDLDHARYVHDQLNVLSPLFLAITAGTPIVKGKMSDWDVRWNIISGSVDDRPIQERDPTNPRYIPDSRYSSTNYYVWDGDFNRPQYNDYDLKISENQKQRIIQQSKNLNIEIDDHLVNHVANIMKRDILIVHQNFPHMSDEEYTLFEMLNGTNWNSVRLKIPIDDDIGWRVQFRTMQVQLTADQNAAYSLIIHLITRILHQQGDLNFYIPITKLRQNFARAHKKDALMKEKFYFRTNFLDKGEPIIEQLTIHEILFGKPGFEGIFRIFMQRLQHCIKMCEKVKILTDSIENFLKQKTTGQRLTLAQWMRNFVNNDPRYKKNSIVPKQVMDDLLIKLYDISKGVEKDHNFRQIFHLWELGGKLDTQCCKQPSCELKEVKKEVVIGQN